MTFRDFLGHAEKLCDDARRAREPWFAHPYVIGSILISWMSIEAFIDKLAQDSTLLKVFSTHELGFIREKQVKFETSGKKAGDFYLSNASHYIRLEDKILFLLARFGKSGVIDKGSPLWQRFNEMKRKRNSLAHPKAGNDITVSIKDAEDAIMVVRALIDFVSSEVLERPMKW